jgi:RNA polymerase sigma-70 factor, ECF subfamily
VVTIGHRLDGASGSRPQSAVPRTSVTTAPPPSTVEDAESREWLRCLRADGEVRDEALARLHSLLLRAARFEVERRRRSLPNLRGNELEDIACEAADDALMSVLRRLDDFRGASRFTTWVYKFAILEAAVKLRGRSWQSREVPREPEDWTQYSSPGLGPAEELEQQELLTAVQRSIAETLTPHQRHVLTALALDGVPIDVLAEQMQTTRGALYKTLHDARRRLRRHLTEAGLVPSGWTAGLT